MIHLRLLSFVWAPADCWRLHYHLKWQILVSIVKVTKIRGNPRALLGEKRDRWRDKPIWLFRPLLLDSICNNWRPAVELWQHSQNFGMNFFPTSRWVDRKFYHSKGSFEVSRTFQRHLDSSFPTIIARSKILKLSKNPNSIKIDSVRAFCVITKKRKWLRLWWQKKVLSSHQLFIQLVLPRSNVKKANDDDFCWQQLRHDQGVTFAPVMKNVVSVQPRG